jgi:hypothetical protein
MNEENKEDSTTEGSINKRLSNIEKAIKRIEKHNKETGAISTHNQLEQMRLALDHYFLSADEAKSNTSYHIYYGVLYGISIGIAIASLGVAESNSFLETAGWVTVITAISLVPISYFFFYTIRYFKKTIKK